MGHVCKLSERDLANRRRTILHDLKARVIRANETKRGMQFQFPATTEMIGQIADFIDFERGCCEFMSFILSVPPRAEVVTLEINGVDSEAKRFVLAEVESLLAKGELR